MSRAPGGDTGNAMVEFTFLAVVPGTWRGDLCAISCTARGEKESLFSSSVAAAASPGYISASLARM